MEIREAQLGMTRRRLKDGSHELRVRVTERDAPLVLEALETAVGAVFAEAVQCEDQDDREGAELRDADIRILDMFALAFWNIVHRDGHDILGGDSADGEAPSHDARTVSSGSPLASSPTAAAPPARDQRGGGASEGADACL